VNIQLHFSGILILFHVCQSDVPHLLITYGMWDVFMLEADRISFFIFGV